jgi:hypothetical protein
MEKEPSNKEPFILQGDHSCWQGEPSSLGTAKMQISEKEKIFMFRNTGNI